MSIRIPSDLEAQLRQHAAIVGKDLETFAVQVLYEKVANSKGVCETQQTLTSDQKVAEWLSWTASHPRLGYVVDDGRESIYAGREE
jgi:hypothetical protein